VYDTILFDLDGTLTNPKLGITKSIQYALEKFGIREENLDSLAIFIGPPLTNTFM
jgi:phosphoglycolate phosphatase